MSDCIGSSFDDMLREDGTLEEIEKAAKNRIAQMDKSPREKLIELESFALMCERFPTAENKAKLEQKRNELALWIGALIEENARLASQNDKLIKIVDAKIDDYGLSFSKAIERNYGKTTDEQYAELCGKYSVLEAVLSFYREGFEYFRELVLKWSQK